MAGGVTCRVGARSEAFSLIVIPSRQIPQSAKRAVIRLMNTNWLKSESERGPERSCRFNTLGTYLWWSLCTLYLHACQVRFTVGDSGLCCCTCVFVVVLVLRISSAN